MKKAKKLIAAAILSSASMAAMAGPIVTFNVSVGIQPSNVGAITLTQVDATTVDIFVDLLEGYGFVNTGGPHTPLAFNVAGSGTPSIGTWYTPVNGAYSNGIFSLNLTGGANMPYGSYGVALDNSAGNGSGNAYYGDLHLTLTRASGLDTTSFVANSSGWYFSADLTDRTNTGAQAWKVAGAPVPNLNVPEPNTLALAGLAMLSLAGIRRRRNSRRR